MKTKTKSVHMTQTKIVFFCEQARRKADDVESEIQYVSSCPSSNRERVKNLLTIVCL